MGYKRTSIRCAGGWTANTLPPQGIERIIRFRHASPVNIYLDKERMYQILSDQI